MNHAWPDGDRAAGPRRQPCPYGSVSIFKEQTLGAYPRREARGPCPSRTGRVKVVRPAERHRCLFVAFRSAKVATDPRYFRGAKGDNSSPAYRRPSWDCANRASVDLCLTWFRSKRNTRDLPPRGQSPYENWDSPRAATAIPLRKVRFACPRLHVRTGEGACAATRLRKHGTFAVMGTLRHLRGAKATISRYFRGAKATRAFAFPERNAATASVHTSHVALTSSSPVRSEALWTCVIIAHASRFLSISWRDWVVSHALPRR